MRFVSFRMSLESERMWADRIAALMVRLFKDQKSVLSHIKALVDHVPFCPHA